MVFRDQHWTDDANSSGGRTRTISNFVNYYDQVSGLYVPVDLDVEDDQTTPVGWTGPFDFKYQVKRSNLQIFAHDLSTPSDAAVIGIRRADNYNHWVVMKALGVTTGSHVVDGAKKAIRWPNCWTNSHLNFQATRGGVKKRIDLLSSGHPSYFEFNLKMPSSANVASDGAGGLYIVAGGQNRLHLKAPYGWDSSVNGELNPSIRITGSIESNTVSGQNRNVKLRLTPNASDLSGATYPVYLDPTTTIGFGSIEDTYILKTSDTFNYGAVTNFNVGRNANDQQLSRALVRVDEAQIPTGSIVGFRVLFYQWSDASASVGGTITIYQVRDPGTPDNDWVVGTAAGAEQAGSCAWAWAKWNTQSWAGGDGLVAPTDYFSAGSTGTYVYSAYTVGADVQRTVTLPPVWATQWKLGTRPNEGTFWLSDGEGSNNTRTLMRSTEFGSNEPSFEVDVGTAALATGCNF
jgi:hypothetical protein